MIIKKTLQSAYTSLKGSPSPALDAEILLGFVIHKPREYLLAHPEQELTTSQQKKYEALVKKRVSHVPIAYLIGEKEFFGERFIVTPDVLIPRPETETILEFVINILQKENLFDKNITVADIGTGSGAIALSIAKILNNAHVIASDISKKARAVVKQNLEIHPEVQNVSIIESDLLINYAKKPIDVLIANLPYLSEEVYENTSKDVHFEPKKALVADDDGMYYIKKLFTQLSPFISKKMHLFLEIDPHQFTELSKTLIAQFPASRMYPIFSEGSDCIIGLYAEIKRS